MSTVRDIMQAVGVGEVLELAVELYVSDLFRILTILQSPNRLEDWLEPRVAVFLKVQTFNTPRSIKHIDLL